MLTADAVTHISHDEHGVAWLSDTQVKVLEVAADYLAHGWSPEEMAINYEHLSLGQIHAAMGYFHDHRAEIEGEIEICRQRAEELRPSLESTALRDRLPALRARQ